MSETDAGQAGEDGQGAFLTLKTAAGRHVIWYLPGSLGPFEPRLFEPGWLAATGRITGQAGGRGMALFLRHAGRDLVLRHFFRGGLAARFLGDRFFRLTTVARSRAMRECMLLQHMCRQGLPVPRPCAARFMPRGLWYSADLLTELVPGTQSLAARLTGRGPLPQAVWARIGATLAAFHAAGVHHTDLNCHNILLDEAGKVWLVDFDKGGIRAGDGWKAATLARLHRSLAKETAAHPGFGWTEADWPALTAGYAEAAAPSAATGPQG